MQVKLLFTLSINPYAAALLVLLFGVPGAFRRKRRAEAGPVECWAGRTRWMVHKHVLLYCSKMLVGISTYYCLRDGILCYCGWWGWWFSQVKKNIHGFNTQFVNRKGREGFPAKMNVTVDMNTLNRGFVQAEPWRLFIIHIFLYNNSYYNW